MQPSNHNFFCPCQFLTQHGAIDVIHPHTKTHMLYKKMWKSCYIQKSKILEGFLADFPMLQLFCIFAFLPAKTILCPLKCDKFAKFFRIWLKFVEFAQIIFTFLGKTLCNIWKFAKKPNMDFWILLCYRFFAFFIQHSHTEKIFWYHH